MPKREMRPKYIASLTFRGFTVDPTEVEAIVGTPATELLARGAPIGDGRTKLKRSIAQWAREFQSNARMVDLIPDLIRGMGGVEPIVAARRLIAPEFLEVDISAWIKDSPDQEGGFISQETIAMLHRLGATLSFGFYSMNAR